MDFITLDASSVAFVPASSINKNLPHISEALSNHNDEKTIPHAPSIVSNPADLADLLRTISALSPDTDPDSARALWTQPDDALASPEQAATMLCRSTATLENWRRARRKDGGTGPAFMDNDRRPQYRVGSLRDYVKSCEI